MMDGGEQDSHLADRFWLRDTTPQGEDHGGTATMAALAARRAWQPRPGIGRCRAGGSPARVGAAVGSRGMLDPSVERAFACAAAGSVAGGIAMVG